MKTITTHCEAAANSVSEPASRHETAGRQGGERDRDGLEQAHPWSIPDDPEQGEHAGEHDRQSDVEEPDPACGRPDPLGEGVGLGAGFSDSRSCRPPTRRRGRTASASTMIPIPPTHCVNWRQRSSEWSTASTLRQDRGPGRREPGHRLEERVDGVVELRVAGEEVGDRAEDGGEQPGQGDDEIPLTEADAAVRRAEPLEPEARRPPRSPPRRRTATATRRRRAQRPPARVPTTLRYLSSVPVRPSAAPRSTASRGARARPGGRRVC